MENITKETYLDWYKDMLFWRKFEDKAAALYIQQKIRGFLHLYNGQEAIAAGTSHVLDLKKDKMITAYRCHVLPMAMGLDPKKIMAELMGKATGTSQGNGGSMHIFSKEHNFYGGHGIVGGQIPLGAGLAFGDKYNKTGGVTITYFGDGAVRQGSFHETLNMAMNWKLPVVFVIENNQYAMGTSVNRTANHEDIYKLGLGYEMPCVQMDAMNPETVAEVMEEAVQRARRGEGPTLVEAKTYRYRGHSMSDAQKYRTKAEVAEYQKLDPIAQVKAKIDENSWADEAWFEEVANDVKTRVAEVVKFAEESPFPTKEQIFSTVYAQEDYPFLPSNQ